MALAGLVGQDAGPHLGLAHLCDPLGDNPDYEPDPSTSIAARPSSSSSRS
ncbi:hypothetical protein JHV675_51910 [Mycobacterium avium subsp. hominissuis]